MTNLTDLRRRCALTMGKEIDSTELGSVWVWETRAEHGKRRAYRAYQPDKDDSQLVECIEWLRARPEAFGWNVIVTTRNWREAIMRAVVEVGK